MNLRNMLALEPGFEARPLGSALPRGQAIPLPPPERLLSSGVAIAADGKMRTAFERGVHYSQWRYGEPEHKISGSGAGRTARSAPAFHELPRSLPKLTADDEVPEGWTHKPAWEYVPPNVKQVLTACGNVFLRPSELYAYQQRQGRTVTIIAYKL